ncbi:hypothetical protein EWB00_003184 [Schistosoma japonicum]|uniref:Uncharacterized protein n=2 Tax=Schistosoma japonicum TaxID=6182 RepID=A0A4Z2DX09_SCHJA|nr:hypothetical protein EWB00_003184 [Schistosoma japonicum]
MKFTTFHDHLIINIIIVTLELCVLLNVIKCQMTQEQLNLLNLLHNKLTNDPHNSRVFVQSQSKHSKNLIWNNTLQQYAESHVKQFNPNVMLARQHYNNSLGVNIGDNGDVKRWKLSIIGLSIVFSSFAKKQSLRRVNKEEP